MINAISIFTKGGVVLWSYYFIKLKGNPIDSLIKTVLLEERTSQAFAYIAPFNLKWKLLNDLNLILVVVYQGFQQLVQLDSFLDTVASEFLIAAGGKSAIKIGKDYSSFNEKFLKIMRKLEQPKAHSKDPFTDEFPEPRKSQLNGQNHLDFGESLQRKSSSITSADKDESIDSDNDDDYAFKNYSTDSTELIEPKATNPDTVQPKYKFMPKARKEKKKKHDPKEKKPEKTGTTWELLNNKITVRDINIYDKSKNKDHKKSPTIEYKPSNVDFTESESEESSTESEKSFEPRATKSNPSKFTNFFNSVSSAVKNFTGNMVLTENELEKPLADFKSALMAKNVAEEIAEMVTSSVKSSLIGDKSTSFTSARQMVKGALTDAIQTILTPKKSIDVLQAALESKQKGKVYSMVFLGVNGVGKSTNLAKVCYYLKKKGGLKVMIVACDTFRSGAVEQLKHHAKCLDVSLFERGYGKDAAQIAQEGLRHAYENGFDVVLIDTAGRMQDNMPLMRSLGKLIALNNPDLILFVGEALVGNDGVDQIKKFNQCLIDMSTVTNSRKIDGILLTKFDTVDDKVGAALSMVYITGQPIVFIGVGQKYTDLKKLKAKTCVKALID